VINREKRGKKKKRGKKEKKEKPPNSHFLSFSFEIKKKEKKNAFSKVQK